jgi:uncharacterized membrane protein
VVGGVNARLWRRLAVATAAAAVGYLRARAVRQATAARRAVRLDEDACLRSYTRAVTIYRPPAEVYAFWRNLPNLARALGRVVRVDEVDDQRSRWVVEEPGGSEVEFLIELLADEPERLLAWRAEDAPVPHEGQVEFARAPGKRGTEVRLSVTCLAGGPAGIEVGPLAGDRVDRLLYDALRRVKQIMEAGEVLTVEGRSSGSQGALPRRLIATGG